MDSKKICFLILFFVLPIVSYDFSVQPAPPVQHTSVQVWKESDFEPLLIKGNVEPLRETEVPLESS